MMGILQSLPIQRRHVREFGLVVLAHIGSAFALIMAVKVLTRVLVPAEYGHVAIVTSYVVAAMTVLVAPITGAGMVEYHDAVRDGRELQLTGTLFIGACVSMLLPLIGFFVVRVPQVASHLPMMSRLVTGGFLLLAAELFKTPVISMTSTARRRGWYAALMLLDGWGKVILVLAALYWTTTPTAEMVIFAYAANGFLAGAIGWAQILAHGMRGMLTPSRVFFSPIVLRSLMRSGWSFAGIGLAGWIINLSDRVLLGFMVPAAAVGIYVAASQSASVISSGLSALITGTINPVLLQRQAVAPADAAVQFGRAILLTVWLVLPAVVIALADPGLLIRIITSERYLVSAPLLVWLVPALGCLAVTNTATIAFWMSKRVSGYARIAGAAGVLNVIVNLALVPRLGIKAAAISTLLTYVAQLAGTLIIGHRYVPWRFRMRDLAPLLGGVVALVPVLLLLREHLIPIAAAFTAVSVYFATSVAVFMIVRRLAAEPR